MGISWNMSHFMEIEEESICADCQWHYFLGTWRSHTHKALWDPQDASKLVAPRLPNTGIYQQLVGCAVYCVASWHTADDWRSNR